MPESIYIATHIYLCHVIGHRRHHLLPGLSVAGINLLPDPHTPIFRWRHIAPSLYSVMTDDDISPGVYRSLAGIVFRPANIQLWSASIFH